MGSHSLKAPPEFGGHVMASTPETRLSLLARVKDPADREAWYEFVEVYRPVIYRLAQKKGMQHADAEDLIQQVLVNVAKAIERWQPDPKRGRFRSWLHRIARNLIINSLSRRKPDRGSGDTAMLAVLDQQPAHDGPDSELLRAERRREIFRWAARQIRPEFQPATWEAFWQTGVDGKAAADVARSLDKTVGAVYAARGRVMRRLMEKIAEFDGGADDI